MRKMDMNTLRDCMGMNLGEQKARNARGLAASCGQFEAGKKGDSLKGRTAAMVEHNYASSSASAPGAAANGMLNTSATREEEGLDTTQDNTFADWNNTFNTTVLNDTQQMNMDTTVVAEERPEREALSNLHPVAQLVYLRQLRGHLSTSVFLINCQNELSQNIHAC